MRQFVMYFEVSITPNNAHTECLDVLYIIHYRLCLRVFTVVIEHYNQKRPGEKGFVSLSGNTERSQGRNLSRVEIWRQSSQIHDVWPDCLLHKESGKVRGEDIFCLL